jgi:hypothetical protein
MDNLKTSLFRYFPLKNSSVTTAMQRFLKENYRKNLVFKFIHINNVIYLRSLINPVIEKKLKLKLKITAWGFIFSVSPNPWFFSKIH